MRLIVQITLFQGDLCSLFFVLCPLFFVLCSLFLLTWLHRCATVADESNCSNYMICFKLVLTAFMLCPSKDLLVFIYERWLQCYNVFHKEDWSLLVGVSVSLWLITSWQLLLSPKLLTSQMCPMSGDRKAVPRASCPGRWCPSHPVWGERFFDLVANQSFHRVAKSDLNSTDAYLPKKN